MLRLDVTYDWIDSGFAADDEVNLYWNVDEDGNASGSPDYTEPINESPIRIFANADPVTWLEDTWLTGPWLSDIVVSIEWLVDPWLEGGWLTGSPRSTVAFQTPDVHFGSVQIAAKSIDTIGNEQSGDANVTTIVVNSTPLGVTRFERGDYDDETGRQWFSFTESPQLEQ